MRGALYPAADTKYLSLARHSPGLYGHRYTCGMPARSILLQLFLTVALLVDGMGVALGRMVRSRVLIESGQLVVLSNDRYIEMYGLSKDVVKPGCTLRRVLEHRRDVGMLPGDVAKSKIATLAGQALTQLRHSVHLSLSTVMPPKGEAAGSAMQTQEKGGNCSATGATWNAWCAPFQPVTSPLKTSVTPEPT